MKDIPVFTTVHGAASLVLREIPHSHQAYIRLQATQEPEAMLADCVNFCRDCGAERISASGHPYLERFPLVTAVVEMKRSLEELPQTDALLLPVLPETVESWLELYNTRMAHVPNAAFLSRADGCAMLQKGDGYFVHRDGKLLGIGRASGGTIDALAAVEPGAGRDVLLALCSALSEDTAELTVATANLPAVRLYEALGFLTVREISRWYRVV
ncbi:MAG: hypothetical protein LUJ09_07935 [Firmicutes bacterium]|nr:hypothetical protein [Bacillota bacterium]